MRKIIVLLFVFSLFSTTSCARRVVVTPPATQQLTVVKTLPRGYKVVRVNGKRYYRYDGNYYRKTRRGYVVVIPFLT